MKNKITEFIKITCMLTSILISNFFLAQKKKDYVGHVTLIKKNELDEKTMVPPFKITSIDVKCIKTLKDYGKKYVVVVSDANTKPYWNNIILEVKDNSGNMVGNWGNISSNFITPAINLQDGQNVTISLRDGLMTGYAGNGNPFTKTVPNCSTSLSPQKPSIKKMSEVNMK